MPSISPLSLVRNGDVDEQPPTSIDLRKAVREATDALIGFACVMMFAVDGMAQRRARGGTPYVRATAGNITINMPVQAAGEEANAPQPLLGATWACAAQRVGAAEITVRCNSGDASVSFTRRACEPFALSLGSVRETSASYTLNTGCE